MKLKYFSWIRERIGVGEEDVALPNDVSTLGQLLVWMRTRGEGYAFALEEEGVVRVALNQTLVDDMNAEISNTDEAAFFPPMTGG